MSKSTLKTTECAKSLSEKKILTYNQTKAVKKPRKPQKHGGYRNDRVIVAGYEDWDSTITEVKDYGSNGWRYQIKSIRDSEIGHEEQGYPEYESNISLA